MHQLKPSRLIHSQVTVVETLRGHLVQVSAVCLHALIWKCGGCVSACAYKLHIPV